jgi:hypothetical protein
MIYIFTLKPEEHALAAGIEFEHKRACLLGATALDRGVALKEDEVRLGRGACVAATWLPAEMKKAIICRRILRVRVWVSIG